MSNNNLRNKALLVGIILDVSSSMRRNWKNDDDEEMPRIEVIRNALNKEIKRQSILHGQNTQGEIDIFCLGMGFKRTETLFGVNLTNDQEQVLEGEAQTISRVDIVCDVLALSELIPTKEELESLKAQLNNKWNQYATSSLQKVQIEDEIYEKLRYYIRSSLYESANSRLRHSLKHKIYVKLKGGKYTYNFRLLKWMMDKVSQYVTFWKQRIETKSTRESVRYFASIQEKARDIFDRNTEKYVEFIKNKLQQFIDTQTDIILTLLTIGYTTKDVLDYFDKTKATDLAREIYEYLYEEVTESIRLAWAKSKAILIISEKDLKSKINYGHVKQLTEKSIQKYGWSILNPFVEQLVFDMFEKSFESSAKRKFNDWIEFSSKREITRPIQEINNILPETFDKSVYSDEFIFGSTPIETAIHLATARLLERTYQELKKSGIIIICLCITNKNIIEKLIDKAPKWWPEGAKILFEAASIVDSEHYLVQRISQAGREVPEGVKLFYQINQAKILTEILEAIFSH
jgi:hypothetical protein